MEQEGGENRSKGLKAGKLCSEEECGRERGENRSKGLKAGKLRKEEE